MNTHQRKQAIGVFLAILFILAIVSIFYTVFWSVKLSEITLSEFFYHIAQFMGLTGFLFISLLIISGDFARLFDSVFGIDRIIKTQRKFAIFTYFIVFSHPLFIILSDNSVVKYLIPQFSELPFAAATISLYIFAGIMFSSLLYKRVSYKVWQYLHVLTYVLFFFILYHSLNVGTHVDNLIIKIIYYTLIILVIMGIVYRTNYKLNTSQCLWEELGLSPRYLVKYSYSSEELRGIITSGVAQLSNYLEIANETLSPKEIRKMTEGLLEKLEKV